MCSEFYSKFSIREKIGEGTFSEVLKCQSLVTKKMYAVKRLKKQFQHLIEAQRLPELLVLDKLPPHPNVLPMLESIFSPQEGRLFMIFELMEMSLYDLIQTRKRCLPENQVKNMFYQILKGVNHLHSHGIFHRDIKPENILMKKTVVKLADLGSVRGAKSQQPYTEYISTRWYRAPECLLTSGFYGPKMDIWACGCVFYELLTSKPIFPGADEIDQLTKIHQVTGTPNVRIMMKMRRNQSRMGEVKFANYSPMNFSIVLPFSSDGGRDLLKRMLIYDPDVRSNVHRLLEHRYFNDLRIDHLIKPYEVRKQWSHPMILKRVLTEKIPKPKPKVVGVYTVKSSGSKLTTTSWAPSSNTSKVSVAAARIKPNNKAPSSNTSKVSVAAARIKPNNKAPSGNEAKKKPGKAAVRATSKTDPAKSSGKPEVKPPAKMQKVKAISLGIFPTVTCKQQMISKSHVIRSSMKDNSFLPPIPEV